MAKEKGGGLSNGKARKTEGKLRETRAKLRRETEGAATTSSDIRHHHLRIFTEEELCKLSFSFKISVSFQAWILESFKACYLVL